MCLVTVAQFPFRKITIREKIMWLCFEATRCCILFFYIYVHILCIYIYISVYNIYIFIYIYMIYVPAWTKRPPGNWHLFFGRRLHSFHLTVQRNPKVLTSEVGILWVASSSCDRALQARECCWRHPWRVRSPHLQMSKGVVDHRLRSPSQPTNSATWVGDFMNLTSPSTGPAFSNACHVEHGCGTHSSGCQTCL